MSDHFDVEAKELCLSRGIENGKTHGAVADALRAAEERGRRRGVEEGLRVCRAKAQRMRDYAAETLDKESVPKAEACADQADDCGDAIAALAPRDSGPVCWKCGAPYRDAGACGYCQAPRDSGKGEHYDVPCLCGDGSVDPMRCPEHRGRRQDAEG